MSDSSVFHSPNLNQEDHGGKDKKACHYSSYNTVKQIGNGSIGEVFLCVSKDGTDFVAKKTIAIKEDQKQYAQQEVELLRRIKNLPNSKQYFLQHVGDYFSNSKSEMHIFTEYCEHGSLRDYIKKHGELIGDVPIVMSIMWNVSRGVEILHKNDILHRDLKAGNVLVTAVLPKGIFVKLADFGLAKKILAKEQDMTCVGTPGYMAPEVLSGHYKGEADIYSLGALLHYLLVGQSPPDHPKLGFDSNGFPILPKLLSQRAELQKLVFGMMQHSVQNRSSISAVLKSIAILSAPEGEKIRPRRSRSVDVAAVRQNPFSSVGAHQRKPLAKKTSFQQETFEWPLQFTFLQRIRTKHFSNKYGRFHFNFAPSRLAERGSTTAANFEKCANFSDNERLADFFFQLRLAKANNEDPDIFQFQGSLVKQYVDVYKPMKRNARVSLEENVDYFELRAKPHCSIKKRDDLLAILNDPANIGIFVGYQWLSQTIRTCAASVSCISMSFFRFRLIAMADNTVQVYDDEDKRHNACGAREPNCSLRSEEFNWPPCHQWDEKQLKELKKKVVDLRELMYLKDAGKCTKCAITFH